MIRRILLTLILFASLAGGAFAAWSLVRTPTIITIGDLPAAGGHVVLTAAPCDLLAIIRQDDPDLEAIPLTVGEKEYAYTEVRNGVTRDYAREDMQIALRVLDVGTCRTEIVVVERHADQLTAPSGWEIEVATQPNGIRWNDWSTEYEIASPANKIVIENKYPFVEGKGRSRTVTDVLYTPYNKALRVPTVVQAGPQFLLIVAQDVAFELRQEGIASFATPGKLLVDEPAADPNWIARLIPNEHMDFGSFLLDSQWTAEYTFVRIGANENRFASFTCSSAAACGAAQIIRTTYQETRDAFPEAKLISDVDEGRRDFRNAITVAFLLHNRNLARLVGAFGPEILADPLLEEYLTAAYNTGVNRVINVLRIARRDHSTEWTDASGRCNRLNGYAECLLPETKGYIAKLRYIKEIWQEYLVFRP